MNTKHTPGEWYWTDAYPKSSDGERTWSLIGAGGYGILSCDGVGNSPQGLNNEANARLIAAAPEMLVALEKLTNNAEQSAFEDWLERKTPSGDAESVHRQWKESIDFQAYVDEWRHALDAIAKATGASHEVTR